MRLYLLISYTPFKVEVLFAQTKDIILAPEPNHDITPAIKMALKAKKEGVSKTTLFNLSGHVLVDMKSYDKYLLSESI